MAELRYVIKDEVGIHARPAGMLVKLAKEIGSKVTITKGERTVDATKLMAVMSLGAKKGDEVIIHTEDDGAIEKVKSFFEENL